MIQKHKPMSYSFLVKANNDIPRELLEKFNIPTSPVIFRGSEQNQEVSKHFIHNIVETAEKIDKLLKTNISIIWSSEQRQTHVTCTMCNLCKNGFSKENRKVADHCHISGKFRQTLCNTCNLKLQQLNFVPVFFHNLSNYDAHFLVTELGYNTNKISIMPNRKTMESMRKGLKMELVSSDKRLQKLINRTTFKHATIYNENLSVVTLENKIIDFCKPIYIGFSLFDISKTLMYDYHYNVMQKYYGDRINLMYTDTDSLVYQIMTDDFYADLAANPILLNRMDTSNLPQDHPCYISERKKKYQCNFPMKRMGLF